LRRLTSIAAESGEAPAVAEAANHDWVVFVSPGAVAIALEELAGDWPARTGIALIGPGSEQELAEHGILAPRVKIVRPASPPYDADALMRLPPFSAPLGLRVLVLAGTGGRTDWVDALRERGALVRRASIYRSEPIEPGDACLRALRRWSRDGGKASFVFTTADAVTELEQALAGARLRTWARRQRALTLHPRIAGLLQRRGWETVQLIEPGERALLAAIESS
jgi:uroporphyrinogen-III synthase